MSKLEVSAVSGSVLLQEPQRIIHTTAWLDNNTLQQVYSKGEKCIFIDTNFIPFL